MQSQQGRKIFKYETFKNISQPTEFFDTIIVFIKLFMIALTVLVGILYLVKFFHKRNQKDATDEEKCSTRLCKSIDTINNILYHMIIIIYFVIACIVLFAFRDKMWNAVKRGREKMGHITNDILRKTGMKKTKDTHELTKNQIQSFTTDATLESMKKKESCPKEELPAHVKSLGDFMKHVKSNEMKDYAMSLVWWNMLFLLPVYAGLFTSENSSNGLIRMFA